MTDPGAAWRRGLPPDRLVPVEEVRQRLVGAPRLVVLDDDPTGT